MEKTLEYICRKFLEVQEDMNYYEQIDDTDNESYRTDLELGRVLFRIIRLLEKEDIITLRGDYVIYEKYKKENLH